MKKVFWSILVFLLAIGLILVGVLIKEYWINKPICKNCNVLLVSLDTLGAKHLPCYGYGKDTAPNLCKFASDNILFKNSYAQANWTRPSQTSVMTSLYPSTHQVVVPKASQLDPKYETIAKVFRNNGYETHYWGPEMD